MPSRLLFTPRLLQAIARVFAEALSRAAPELPSPASGLESLLVNDTLVTAKWVTEASWPWDKLKHINVCESESALALLRHVALKGGDRSSPRALRGIVKKSAAIQVAASLYLGLGFAPTRYNASDAPTRAVATQPPPNWTRGGPGRVFAVPD